MPSGSLRQLPLPSVLDEAEVLVWSAWSEDSLLAYVRRTALMCGWLVYHTRFSIKSEAGFPDVCLVHPRTGHTLFAELKRQGKWPTEGRLSKGIHSRWITGQREWLKALALANEVYLWWPSDCHDIATILSDPGGGPTPDMACVVRTLAYLEESDGPVGEAGLPDGAAAAAPVASARRVPRAGPRGAGDAVARTPRPRTPAKRADPDARARG